MGIIRESRTLFFTTSPRNPKKLIPEIELLIENFGEEVWSGNKELQEKFSKMLAEAESFEGETSKKHSDFSARDRITRSPKGLGFVDLSPKIRLTKPGEEFLYGKRPHEIFFRQLMKYQLPSPYHKEARKIAGTFWCHPFLEITRLVRDLEYLTPDEFRSFALQLTDYRKYDEIKEKISNFRKEKEKRRGQYKQYFDEIIYNEISEIYAEKISSGDFSTRETETKDKNSFISKEKRNMRDYSDACFRYLRYTEMFLSDGKSLRISPDKITEVDYILSTLNREPIFVDDEQRYKEYLFDTTQPILYSDIRENIEDILMRNYSFSKRELLDKSVDELKDLRDNIIQERRNAIVEAQQQELKSYALYQEVIDTYNEIISDEIYDAPLFFEWNTWRAMTMLNGGSIKGNFKIDDSGRPTSTAQGNMPDIECDYGSFSLSVEVTLQRGQRQYEAEGEPVTRHYAQLLKKSGKETYCLFIAPVINKATWAHFFGLNQIKNITAYGGKPKIVPLELEQFMKLIENSYIHSGTPTPIHVQSFLKMVIEEVDSAEDENDWRRRIAKKVNEWLVV